MRNANCQNIRREIEEAGSAELLGLAAIAHIQDCPACEALSQQHTKLQQIISGLGTVEAPGDFDFRLRARLAGEKGGASASRFSGFSLGLRPVAVAAMLLLLIGAVFVFLNLRNQPVAPVASNPKPPAFTPAVPNPTNAGIALTTSGGSDKTTTLPAKDGTNGNDKAAHPIVRSTRNRDLNNELATSRSGNRFATQDSSSTAATLLKHDDEAYPTAAFPINASYQSLKVSVDDGRGTSRTISVPTVSFGSERSISQNPSPLMVPVRGSW
jgi:hypothetical protein